MASTPVSDILTNQWPSSTMMNVCHTWSHFLCRTLSQNQISKHEEKSRLSLEPVCCKKQQKKVPDQLLTANPFPVMTTGISLCSNSTLFFPVRDCSAGLWNRGPLKHLNDSKLIVYESKSFSNPLIIKDQFYTNQNLQIVTGQYFFLCFLQQTGSINLNVLQCSIRIC